MGPGGDGWNRKGGWGQGVMAGTGRGVGPGGDGWNRKGGGARG